MPLRFGSRPMMVRSSTDLPPPEAPTRPRISPRRTSSERRSSTTGRRIRPRGRAPGSPICRLGAAIGSHSDRGEENGEQAVEHDDQEDRFHHRCRGLLAERSALPLTRRPSTHATTPITSAMNGALIMPTSKCVERDRLAQPRDEDLRAHAAVEPGTPARRHRAPPWSRGRPGIGSATTSASTRGRISTSTGSKPMVRSASISSRIFIEPSSAV